jgi:precorrin-3B synthase
VTAADGRHRGRGPAVAADACPGLLDLHEARDGYVARIRLPGGYVTGRRLRTLAALASGLGNGCVDLTARANVQLRGVRAGDAGELARRAAAAGLLPSPAHDKARNITASPLAGLAGHPDVRWLVRALDRAVLADPDLAGLPGRFIFCLDDGSGRAGLSRCDVGLRRGAYGADLIVAGRHAGLHGPAGPMVDLAAEAARAFLRQRQQILAPGQPTSGQELAPGPGQPRPGITGVAGLPDGGAGIAAALGGALGERVTDNVSRLSLGLVRDHAPTATGTAPSAGPGTAPAGPGTAPAATGSAPAPGPAVVVAAPLARLTGPQLRLLGRMVRPGEVARLTVAGRIVLPLAEPADGALARLAGAGLLVCDDHALATVTACSGMSCAKSLADVRSAAARVAGLAAVHWAGCGRTCGRPADATAVVAVAADQFMLADGRVLPTAAGRA